MLTFFEAGEKVKISTFRGWFCLKHKFITEKIDRAVSCPDSEELWKVLAKSESWFPIQSPKNRILLDKTNR